MLKKLLAGIGALVILGAIIGALSGKEETAGTETSSSGNSQESPKENSGNRATDDSTPHVGPRQAVIVDTLEWRVATASSMSKIGSSFSEETADGIYVVANLTVKNGKTESVTITSGIAKLKVAGATYDTDNSGTTALLLSGGDQETFFLKDLGPNVSTRGSVVFDIPRDAVTKNPEICFGELGFGSSEGCIKLPPL